MSQIKLSRAVLFFFLYYPLLQFPFHIFLSSKFLFRFTSNIEKKFHKFLKIYTPYFTFQNFLKGFVWYFIYNYSQTHTLGVRRGVSPISILSTLHSEQVNRVEKKKKEKKKEKKSVSGSKRESYHFPLFVNCRTSPRDLPWGRFIVTKYRHGNCITWGRLFTE